MIDINRQKNYDENPLIISNRLTVILLGIGFWLLFNFFIIYMVFYTEVINWSQGNDWLNILKEEISRSSRLGTILLMTLVVNAMAMRTFFKSITSLKQIVFENEIIRSDKNFNDLTELKLEDIKAVRKSFFPLLATGGKERNISYFISITIILVFLIISSIMIFFIKGSLWIGSIFSLNDKVYFSRYSYITIFSKKTNRVINIYVSSEKDYLLLESYFLQNLNIDLNLIKKNLVFSSVKGENDE